MRVKPETAAASLLLSAQAVRERAHRLLAIAIDDRLAYFRVDLGRLDSAADLVAATTRHAYPTLDVPLHARWRHFLPPIGGTTVYIFGDVAGLADPATSITCRVHDECNGSDVFGSDICTCRPYLVHGIEECARAAQAGGLGIIVYNRKEGRALGEVTKFLVYNARKRQEGGDAAAAYFERTECVAGVQDARFQQLMPDVLHWLGIARIDRFVSMSDMKYAALTGQGVKIVERVPIPNELVPADAQVEMAAKKAAGYYAGAAFEPQDLAATVGRSLDQQ